MINTIKKPILFSIIGIFLAIVLFFFGISLFIKLIAIMVFIYFSFKNANNGLVFLIIGLPFVSDSTMLLLMIIVSMFYFYAYIKRGYIEECKTFLVAVVVMFGFLILVTTISSVELKLSLTQGSFRDFILHGISILLFFMIIYMKQTKRDMHNIFIAFIISGIMTGIWGIYQYIIKVPMESGWVDLSTNPNIQVRVFAGFENPNIFSLYLLLVLPITLGIAYSSEKISRKMLFYSFWLLLVANLVLTGSRGGWVGFAIGLILYILLTNPKNILGVIIVSILATPLIPDYIWQRILTIGNVTDSSNAMRITIWKTAGEIIKDYWAIGAGLGYQSFMKISPKYFYEMAPYHMHNTFLEFLVETGVIGFILFIVLILTAIKVSFSIVGNSRDKDERNMVCALLVGFISMIVQGNFEHLLYNPKIVVYFWIVICLITASYKNYQCNRGQL